MDGTSPLPAPVFLSLTFLLMAWWKREYCPSPTAVLSCPTAVFADTMTKSPSAAEKAHLLTASFNSCNYKSRDGCMLWEATGGG